MKKEELIGRKIRGFKFKSIGNCIFNENMYNQIGETGYIKEYVEWNNTFRVKFKENNWTYPASEIEKHLVLDELPKQGWAVKNTGEDPEKWKVFIDWGNNKFDGIKNGDVINYFYGDNGNGYFDNYSRLDTFGTEAIELTLTQIYDYIMEQKEKEEFSKLSVKNMVLVSNYEGWIDGLTFEEEFLHDLGDRFDYRFVCKNSKLKRSIRI